METIQEKDGWKILKGENINEFYLETPEGLKTKINPNFKLDDVIRRGWAWVDVEYYTGSIKNSKIEVEKRKKNIQSNRYDLFLEFHHLTKESVIEKLQPILVQAKEKFLNCHSKLEELKKELDFDVDYLMEGDTHGIYQDYMYISFTIEGIHCHFEMC